MALLKYFKTPGLSPAEVSSVKDKVATYFGREVTLEIFEAENCIYIDTDGQKLEGSEIEKLSWLFRETFEPHNFGNTSFLDLKMVSVIEPTKRVVFVELGPRLNFSTAWSTNAINIFRSCGLNKVLRIEQSRRLLLRLSNRATIDAEAFRKAESQFVSSLYDRMTEMIYKEPLTSFKLNMTPENWFKVPVLEQGRAALEKINKEMGLAFDDWDLDYYTELFKEKIQRDPTSVECFDLSQSNSEHSRHWFFKGKMVIDGQEMPFSLFDLVMDTLKNSPSTNSLIAYRDNARAIKGSTIKQLRTTDPTTASQVEPVEKEFALTFTAETHNFPTGIAPFPGAETGTGGRLRDTHCAGRGALIIAGTAGYSVGNLNIPNYPLPWEDSSWSYPSNMAKPLQIEIEASNGASDYGNKFGEPVIVGFTRSLGIKTPNGERREYIKPIMFTGGFGQMSMEHLKKGDPEVGMIIVKLGGPAYRIGIGGGAASSMAQGQNDENLDFNAVQRGDAEMESKMNRVIRACVELGSQNPIVSIHDQGAGGNGNVLKEIVEPIGAKIEIRKILVGDETLSVLEIWGAEYQEADALLIKPEDMEFFSSLCQREGCPVAYVGVVTGDGRVVVHDEMDDSTPFDLELDHVLGKMPRKTFNSNRMKVDAQPLNLDLKQTSDHNAATKSILDRVLRLLSVGSKRFLVHKVDRSVSGLIAQQQCVGPLHIPLANNAVTAQSYFGLTGGATSIGEQPFKTLLNPAAMARMTVGEALTNLIFTKVSSLQDVKCSANWMWPAKLPGEGASIYDAVQGLHDVLVALGVAIDGGKDSLSMAAKVTHPDNTTEMVKAPGTLVLSTNCSVPDVTKKITPDIKAAGESKLIFISLSEKQRLGCSALAQVYNQLGDACPDFENVDLFKSTWDIVQRLIGEQKLLAGHDRSDGGLLVTLLEMAFAGDCGLKLSLDIANDLTSSIIPYLFNEELGLVFEVHNSALDAVVSEFNGKSIPVQVLGDTTVEKTISITAGNTVVLHDSTVELRDIWEATSFELEMRQKNPKCIVQEKTGLKSRKAPPLKLSFTPVMSIQSQLKSPANRPRIAILREEGSNGDREMVAAWYSAGFDVWDVKMSDFVTSAFSLQSFRGVAFVGGFSYADVLGSAKGWAGVTRFNEKIFKEFNDFYARKNTFSLGVCNGCQLMALLGWVPFGRETPDEKQPRFIRNLSEHFESRYSTVKILPSPAMMLKGMEGSTLGIWVAHGEGRAYFPDHGMFDSVIQKNLAPIRYVDDENNHTEQYPFNPNGSPLGIASLCSEDGRHLAIMPHPERCFLKWQLPWMPADWQALEASPWLQIFQNARVWCDETA